MLNEIENFMNSTNTSINYRIVNLGGNVVYIEGIKNVVNFGSNEMQFQLKKGLCLVNGSNLVVKSLDKTTCVVQGQINRVEVR